MAVISVIGVGGWVVCVMLTSGFALGKVFDILLSRALIAARRGDR